ncbi:Subtilisin inhibitor [Thalictrum thalictroides]|uniref:Subtilisin inhibitor n=1 Tax=Thalictrum thalictroides TaxID=46969 RepID=A0A7J6VUW3_THATH|nr:Subtilisin inhibitor [Thalictrum thalictroides]
MADENKQTEETQEQPSLPLPILGHQMSDGASSGGKTQWPELMGLTVEEAKEKILLDMPRVVFQVVPPGHFVTMDFNTRRVRLYVDASGKIARAPQVG